MAQETEAQKTARIWRENRAREYAAPPTDQVLNLTTEQVRLAAIGGLTLLGRETTLVPGNLRQQVAVLEAILNGLVNGGLLVVTPQQIAVESPLGKPEILKAKKHGSSNSSAA